MAESAFDLNVGRETILSLIANFTGAIFGFAGVVIFARAFPVASFGSAYVLLAAVAVGHTITGGVGDAIAKRASEADVPTDRMLWVGLFAHTVYWVTAGLTVFPLVLMVQPFGIERSLLWGAFVAFVGVGYFIIAGDALTGDGYPARTNWTDAVRSVLTFTIQVGFLLTGLGVESIPLGLGIASLVVAVGIIGWLAPRPKQPTREDFVSVYTFAVWSTPRNLLSRLYTRVVLFLLGTVSGGAAAARYKASRQLTVPSALSSSAFQAPLSVKISADASREQESEEQINFALAFLGLLPIPIFFGALALGNELVVTTYGPKYTGVGPILALVALGRIAGSYSTVLASVLYGNNYPAQLARIRFLQLLVLLVAAAVLYLPFGPLGIVGGFVFSQAVGLVTYAVMTRSYVGNIRPALKEIAIQTLAGAIMCGVVYGTELMLLTVTTAFDAGILVCLGGITYSIVVLSLSGRLRSALSQTLR